MKANFPDLIVEQMKTLTRVQNNAGCQIDPLVPSIQTVGTKTKGFIYADNNQPNTAWTIKSDYVGDSTEIVINDASVFERIDMKAILGKLQNLADVIVSYNEILTLKVNWELIEERCTINRTTKTLNIRLTLNTGNIPTDTVIGVIKNGYRPNKGVIRCFGVRHRLPASTNIAQNGEITIIYDSNDSCSNGSWTTIEGVWEY